MANVEPESISYVEAHGTGTPMGDPIEVRALTSAFRERSDLTGFCTIGSVKTNIGHADTAAGIAGLIKTVLALQHRQLPPSLNFDQPNPQLELGSSPFIVSTALKAWTGPLPLRAAVSSFGMGGTNAHVILEEAPPTPATTPAIGGHDVAESPDQLLVLSARSPAALAAANAGLASWLADRPEASLASVASTLQTGRSQHAHRQAISARSVQDARAGTRPKARRQWHPRRLRTASSVYVLGPGARSTPTWAASCISRGRLPAGGRPMRRTARAAPRPRPFERRSFPVRESSKALIDTAIVQPALFTVEYALARLLMTLGLGPVATIGHSIGGTCPPAWRAYFLLRTPSRSSRSAGA